MDFCEQLCAIVPERWGLLCSVIFHSTPAGSRSQDASVQKEKVASSADLSSHSTMESRKEAKGSQESPRKLKEGKKEKVGKKAFPKKQKR